MNISIIAAIAQNGIIGNNNKLIWHISEDLKRFKKLTSGNPIIMGRKTYESLPIKPLPNRKNIILTRQNKTYEGAYTAKNIEEALKLCDAKSEIFICGGAEIYKLFLPSADKMYLTIVHRNYEGDTYFPEIDYSGWQKIQDEKHTGALNYSFKTYIRA